MWIDMGADYGYSDCTENTSSGSNELSTISAHILFYSPMQYTASWSEVQAQLC